MKLFRMEFYKIIRKPVLWFWFAAAAGFMIFYFAVSTPGSESCVIDGIRYTGFAAIEKDRELARQWEGPLTMEKLYSMLDAYGPTLEGDTDLPSARGGNYVSRYATDLLTDYMQGGNGAFRGEDELSFLAERLEEQKPWFGYMGGCGNLLTDNSMVLNIALALLVIIALAPVFSEEYALRTASLLLTCVHGSRKDAAAKICAGLTAAGGSYLAANGLLAISTLMIYGTDGLRVSSSLYDGVSLHVFDGSFLAAYLYNFFWGFAGILMLAALTLFFSAKCKTPFHTVICSLASFAAAFLLLNGLSKLLYPSIAGKLCYVVGKWSPLYLPLTFGWGELEWEMPWKLIYTAAVSAAGIWLAARCYRRHEC